MLRAISISLFLVVLLQPCRGYEEMVPVSPEDAPYHVSVQWVNPVWGSKEHVISGVILDETHILTVAYTIRPPETLFIIAGRQNLLNPFVGQESVIKEFTPHPDYVQVDSGPANPDTPHRHNIAIGRLITPLVFNEDVQPIRLPSSTNQSVPLEGGLLTDWRYDSRMLHKLIFPLIPNPECERIYGKFKIDDYLFCGGEMEGDLVVDTSTAFDRGAVLLCKDEDGEDYFCGIQNAQPILNAICEGPDGRQDIRYTYPAAFAHIAKYVDWINGVLKKNN